MTLLFYEAAQALGMRCSRLLQIHYRRHHGAGTEMEGQRCAMWGMGRGGAAAVACASLAHGSCEARRTRGEGDVAVAPCLGFPWSKREERE
jgi:hypothetical protein